jgi:hypothetical protein
MKKIRFELGKYFTGQDYHVVFFLPLLMASHYLQTVALHDQIIPLQIYTVQREEQHEDPNQLKVVFSCPKKVNLFQAYTKCRCLPAITGNSQFHSPFQTFPLHLIFVVLEINHFQAFTDAPYIILQPA